MLYTVFDLLVDAALFSSWENGVPPNRLPGSVPRKDISNAIHGAFQELQFDPNLPIVKVPLTPKQEDFRRAVGAKVWKHFEETFDRLRSTVKEVCHGLSPDEIRVLQESGSANHLLTDYVLALNHAAVDKVAGAEVTASLKQGLPMIKENLQAHVKQGLNAHRFDDVLQHVAGDAEHLSKLRQHSSAAQQVRVVNQAFTHGFSSWKNFKTTLGSAAKMDHVGASTLFYVGTVGLLHSAYDVLRPETKEEIDGTRKHSWRTTVLESTASMAALIGGLVMAGRRIPMSK